MAKVIEEKMKKEEKRVVTRDVVTDLFENDKGYSFIVGTDFLCFVDGYNLRLYRDARVS